MTRWTPPRPPSSPRTVLITPRMADVLDGICNGWTNARIARHLGTSEETVKSQVSRLLGRMRCRDRAHAAAMACSGQVVIEIKVHTRRKELEAA